MRAGEGDAMASEQDGPSESMEQKLAREEAVLARAEPIRARRATRAPAAQSDPPKPKCHWDHLLEEMKWMQNEFAQESKLKARQLKSMAHKAARSKMDVASRGIERQKEEQQRLRKAALSLAKDVVKFWTKSRQVVTWTMNEKLESAKRAKLETELDAFVGQSERFSQRLVTQPGEGPTTSSAQAAATPQLTGKNNKTLALPSTEGSSERANGQSASARATPAGASQHRRSDGQVASDLGQGDAGRRGAQADDGRAAGEYTECVGRAASSDRGEGDARAAVLECQSAEQPPSPARGSAAQPSAATRDAARGGEAETGVAAGAANGVASSPSASWAGSSMEFLEEPDDEATLEEEETLAAADAAPAGGHGELNDLAAEADLPLEELLARYQGGHGAGPEAAEDDDDGAAVGLDESGLPGCSSAAAPSDQIAGAVQSRSARGAAAASAAAAAPGSRASSVSSSWGGSSLAAAEGEGADDEATLEEEDAIAAAEGPVGGGQDEIDALAAEADLPLEALLARYRAADEAAVDAHPSGACDHGAAGFGVPSTSGQPLSAAEVSGQAGQEDGALGRGARAARAAAADGEQAEHNAGAQQAGGATGNQRASGLEHGAAAGDVSGGMHGAESPRGTDDDGRQGEAGRHGRKRRRAAAACQAGLKAARVDGAAVGDGAQGGVCDGEGRDADAEPAALLPESDNEWEQLVPSEPDDEATLEEEEALAAVDPSAGLSGAAEQDRLAREAELPLEDLLALYRSQAEGEPSEGDEGDPAGEAGPSQTEAEAADASAQPADAGEADSQSDEVMAESDAEEAGGGGESSCRDGDKSGADVAAPSELNEGVAVPFLIKADLRHYQHLGLQWLVKLCKENINGILADEMGLGKTLQTISLLAWLAAERGSWGPHLVVVPTSVMLNWEMEFKRFAPAFQILTYFGTPRERKAKRSGWSKLNSFHVCITSYNLVLQDVKMFKRRKWQYLILDEAHMIKNWKSQRWQALLSFTARHRLLITGTPLQNDLMELWSLMHFLMPHIFHSHSQFQDWFNNPLMGMVEGQAGMNAALVARLHSVLRPFVLRRLKSEVEKQLPGKYEHLVQCRLSRRQRKLYQDFLSARSTREKMSSGSYIAIMNVLMQLRKVCNHPDLFEGRRIVSAYDMPALTLSVPRPVAQIRRPTPWDHGVEDWEAAGLVPAALEATSSTAASYALERAVRMGLDISQQEERLRGEASAELAAVVTSARASGVGRAALLALEASMRGTALRRIATAVATFTRNAGISMRRCRMHAPLLGCDLRAAVEVDVFPRDLQLLGARRAGDVSTALLEAVLTAEQRLAAVRDVVTTFTCVVPAARAPAVTVDCPDAAFVAKVAAVSSHTAQRIRALSKPFHVALVRQQLNFPDRRLIQFDCGKLQELAALLGRLKAEGSRCLIFTQMSKMLDILETFLNLHGHAYMRLDGATKPAERQVLMTRFNSNPKYFVFILSTRSGGVGINLTGANAVIFYDSDWNPAMDQQAQDRCHRIGQTRDVHIYRLVSEHTIEENILLKSNQKRHLDHLAIQSAGFTTAGLMHGAAAGSSSGAPSHMDLASWGLVPGQSGTRRGEGGDAGRAAPAPDGSGAPAPQMAAPTAEEFRMALAEAEDKDDAAAAAAAEQEAAECNAADFDEPAGESRAVSKSGGASEGATHTSKVPMEKIQETLRPIERYAIRIIEEEIGPVDYDAMAATALEQNKAVREASGAKESEELAALMAEAAADDDSNCEENLIVDWQPEEGQRMFEDFLNQEQAGKAIFEAWQAEEQEAIAKWRKAVAEAERTARAQEASAQAGQGAGVSVANTTAAAADVAAQAGAAAAGGSADGAAAPGVRAKRGAGTTAGPVGPLTAAAASPFSPDDDRALCAAAKRHVAAHGGLRSWDGVAAARVRPGAAVPPHLSASHSAQEGRLRMACLLRATDPGAGDERGALVAFRSAVAGAVMRALSARVANGVQGLGGTVSDALFPGSRASGVNPVPSAVAAAVDTAVSGTAAAAQRGCTDEVAAADALQAVLAHTTADSLDRLEAALARPPEELRRLREAKRPRVVPASPLHQGDRSLDGPARKQVKLEPSCSEAVPGPSRPQPMSSAGCPAEDKAGVSGAHEQASAVAPGATSTAAHLGSRAAEKPGGRQVSRPAPRSTGRPPGRPPAVSSASNSDQGGGLPAFALQAPGQQAAAVPAGVGSDAQAPGDARRAMLSIAPAPVHRQTGLPAVDACGWERASGQPRPHLEPHGLAPQRVPSAHGTGTAAGQLGTSQRGAGGVASSLHPHWAAQPPSMRPLTPNAQDAAGSMPQLPQTHRPQEMQWPQEVHQRARYPQPGQPPGLHGGMNSDSGHSARLYGAQLGKPGIQRSTYANDSCAPGGVMAADMGLDLGATQRPGGMLAQSQVATGGIQGSAYNYSSHAGRLSNVTGQAGPGSLGDVIGLGANLFGSTMGASAAAQSGPGSMAALRGGEQYARAAAAAHGLHSWPEHHGVHAYGSPVRDAVNSGRQGAARMASAASESQAQLASPAGPQMGGGSLGVSDRMGGRDAGGGRFRQAHVHATPGGGERGAWSAQMHPRTQQLSGGADMERAAAARMSAAGAAGARQGHPAQAHPAQGHPAQAPRLQMNHGRGMDASVMASHAGHQVQFPGLQAPSAHMQAGFLSQGDVSRLVLHDRGAGHGSEVFGNPRADPLSQLWSSSAPAMHVSEAFMGMAQGGGLGLHDGGTFGQGVASHKHLDAMWDTRASPYGPMHGLQADLQTDWRDKNS